MNIVTIDIGNTNISFGIFKGKKFMKGPKIATGDVRSYAVKTVNFLTRCKLHRSGDVDATVIASVVPRALKRIRGVVKKATMGEIFVAGETIRVPIKNRYAKPHQVGQDRLVNALAARKLYGFPAIVIDFGTAVTFDCISKKGEYLGGVILPGIDLSFRGLYEKTSLLPKVHICPTRNIIGRSTAESIRAGILFGYGAMCDGLVKKFRERIGSAARVVATGGNCRLLKKYASSIQIIDQHLIMKGLLLTFAAAEASLD